MTPDELDTAVTRELVRAPWPGLAPSELAELLTEPGTNLSRALERLVARGEVVLTRRAGVTRYYAP